VLIATILGIPLSYYLVQEYLQRYSERITLTWWYYLIPIFIMLAFMLLTISSVLINAAKANPVESLRHE
jgi:putative ABC transport system permease protein